MIDIALTVTCFDLFHFRTIVTLEIEITQFLVDTGETGSQYSFYTMQLLSFLHFFIGHSRIRTCIGQEPFGENEKIYDTGNGNEDADLSQFEHGEAFIAGFQNHAVHNQIGRSTDQRTDTTQNGHIRKGNQELGGRKLYRFRPMLDDRGKDNYNRSIIQKSRNECYRRQNTQLCLKHRRFSLRKQFFDHLPQCTRLTDTLTYQEQQGNGNHPFITEAFEHFFRSQNAGTQE